MASNMDAKRFGKRFMRMLGFEVFGRKSGYHYVPDVYGRLHGKIDDFREEQPFAELARDVITNREEQRRGGDKAVLSFLYYDKLHTLWQALRNVVRTAPKGRGLTVLEVGVFRGGSLRFLAAALDRLAPERDKTLLGVDTFEGHSAQDVCAGGVDGLQKAGVFSETSFEEVSQYLRSFKNVRLLKGRIQDVFPAVVERCRSFDFVHVDVDLGKPTEFCLEKLSPLVRVGGAMVVDDYGKKSCPALKPIVQEFLRGPGLNTWFLIEFTAAQCMLVKTGAPEAG